MPVKLVECLDWPAVNRPGELLKVTEHLKAENVNLEALWAYTCSHGESKMAAIGKKGPALRAALAKLGLSPGASWCFYLTGTDKAGALVDTVRTLSEAGINVECADAVAAAGKFAAAIWVSATDLPAAKRALKVR